MIITEQTIVDIFHHFGKTLRFSSMYSYRFTCYEFHNFKMYEFYWYQLDHLGSSSFITNTTGEISQHIYPERSRRVEYLPFGETHVEEQLNSYNSPFKFNGKEYDAETGNYYYHSRYYNPKWSLFLGVDEHYFNYPSFSPYAYTFQNPINFIDPDGRDGIRIINKKNKSITIKAIYYVQTEVRNTRTGVVAGYNSKQIAKMKARTNKWLNNQKLSVSEGEYKGYSVKFELDFKEGGNSLETTIKANNEQFEGYDIGNSIERGSSKSDPIHFESSINEDGVPIQKGGFVQNKKKILMNTAHDRRIIQIHEIGHTLGLEDNIKTGAKSGLMEYPPGKISQQEANQLGNSDFLPAVQKLQE